MVGLGPNRGPEGSCPDAEPNDPLSGLLCAVNRVFCLWPDRADPSPSLTQACHACLLKGGGRHHTTTAKAEGRRGRRCRSDWVRGGKTPTTNCLHAWLCCVNRCCVRHLHGAAKLLPRKRVIRGGSCFGFEAAARNPDTATVHRTCKALALAPWRHWTRVGRGCGSLKTPRRSTAEESKRITPSNRPHRERQEGLNQLGYGAKL